jgi:hypothetical protein
MPAYAEQQLQAIYPQVIALPGKVLTVGDGCLPMSDLDDPGKSVS